MNKYLQMIDITDIELGKEYSTLSKLLSSVGLPKYANQLQQMKQEIALKEVLATHGLTYKRINDKSFKVVIVSL